MILLDTHAWVWWCIKSPRLSRRALAAIDATSEIGVAAITCWEVAMLVEHGRLTLDRDVALWVTQALALPRTTLVPLSSDVAVAAGSFGDGLHGDPADRMIVASALSLKAPLVTKDRALRQFKGGLKTIW